MSFYASTNEEAEAKANEAVGTKPGGVKVGTISEFIATTVAPLKARRAPATRDQWCWAMDKYILPAIGHLRPEQLELKHCIAVLAGKTPSTEHTVRKHLSPVVRLLARQKLIPYNYLEEIPSVTPGRREAVLTLNQAWQLAEGADMLVRNAILLSAFCSLTRVEMKNTKRTSIARGTLQIREGLKNLHRKRDIPLPAALEAMLLDGPLCHLVAYRSGDLPHEDTIGDFLRKECQRRDFPLCGLHSLRHTFASSMDAIGCPRGVLIGLMGHSAKSMTDTYVHPTPGAKRLWMERLWEARLDEVLGEGGLDVCHSASSISGLRLGSA